MNKNIFKRAISGAVLSTAIFAGGNGYAALINTGIVPPDILISDSFVGYDALGNFDFIGMLNTFVDGSGNTWDVGGTIEVLNAVLPTVDAGGDGDIDFTSGTVSISGTAIEDAPGSGFFDGLLLELALNSFHIDPTVGGSMEADIAASVIGGQLSQAGGLADGFGSEAILVFGSAYNGGPWEDSEPASRFSQSPSDLDIGTLDSAPPQPVPVPASLALLGLGLLAIRRVSKK